MDFKNIEKLLRELFARTKDTFDIGEKERIRGDIMEAFEKKHGINKVPLWRKIFVPRVSSFAFAVASLFILFNIFPSNQTQLLAGKIHLKSGAVEIIRDGKSILVRDEMQLQKGDIIKVGSSGEAEIVFPEMFSTMLTSKTQLRILGYNEIFLDYGALESKTLNQGEFSTSRGFVKSFPGSNFSLSVSPSGEMKVVARKNEIEIFDWKSGETTLHAGEELSLYTDTELVNLEIPNSISLSYSQLKSIQAKMIIARTKVLTALEKMFAGDRAEAKEDFLSSQNSFKSITQIFDSSRNLEIARRKNMAEVDMAEVVPLLVEKDVNESFVQEARALEMLFAVVEENQNHIAFGLENSGTRSFDRFVLLDRVFSMAPEQEEFAEVLKQKYTAVFLRKIQNDDFKVDQIANLEREIAKLPNNELAREFLLKVRDIMPPHLVDSLDNEIHEKFI